MQTYVGIRGKQSAGMRIKVPHFECNVLPKTMKIIIVQSGKFEIPQGVILSVHEILKIVGHEKARGTGLFVRSFWELETTSENYDFIVSEDAIHYATKSVDHNRYKYDYSGLKTRSYDADKLTSSARGASIETSIGKVFFKCGKSMHVEYDESLPFSEIEHLRAIKKIVLTSPKYIINGNKKFDAITVLRSLWKSLLVKNTELVLVAVACICAEVSNVNLCLLLQLVGAGFPHYFGNPCGFVDDAFVVLCEAYESKWIHVASVKKPEHFSFVYCILAEVAKFYDCTNSALLASACIRTETREKENLESLNFYELVSSDATTKILGKENLALEYFRGFKVSQFKTINEKMYASRLVITNKNNCYSMTKCGVTNVVEMNNGEYRFVKSSRSKREEEYEQFVLPAMLVSGEGYAVQRGNYMHIETRQMLTKLNVKLPLVLGEYIRISNPEMFTYFFTIVRYCPAALAYCGNGTFHILNSEIMDYLTHLNRPRWTLNYVHGQLISDTHVKYEDVHRSVALRTANIATILDPSNAAWKNKKTHMLHLEKLFISGAITTSVFEDLFAGNPTRILLESTFN